MSVAGAALGYNCTTRATSIAHDTPPRKPNALEYIPFPGNTHLNSTTEFDMQWDGGGGTTGKSYFPDSFPSILQVYLRAYSCEAKIFTCKPIKLLISSFM